MITDLFNLSNSSRSIYHYLGALVLLLVEEASVQHFVQNAPSTLNQSIDSEVAIAYSVYSVMAIYNLAEGVRSSAVSWVIDEDIVADQICRQMCRQRHNCGFTRRVGISRHT